MPELLWPTLRAVRNLGGSASVQEIHEEVARIENFTNDQLSEIHNDGPSTRLEYRGRWALSHLKIMGLLDSGSQRGFWETTDPGMRVSEDEIPALHKRKIRERRERLKKSNSEMEMTESDEVETSDEPSDWKSELLQVLLQLSPDAFERLSKRLLDRAGFLNTEVLGRTNDGGIDGKGVYRVSLVSFPVFFQCKRYMGVVGSKEVRDFRGAMAGRGEKGLLITTGRFTVEAQQEATRDGAPPVDLVNGDELCDLLKQYGLGVETKFRTIEDIYVDSDFLKRL